MDCLKTKLFKSEHLKVFANNKSIRNDENNFTLNRQT